VILLELDPDDNMSIKKTYIYANSQIIAQRDVTDNNKIYFYLHDRLGSIRQIIDTNANVKKLYTYNPFGEVLETDGTLSNPFMFTGQWFDSETGDYWLRARQYSPYLYRFTARDPVFGKFQEPLSLHKYLYCQNDPVNKVDPTGEWAMLYPGGYTVTGSLGPFGGEVALTPFFFYGLSDDLTFFCGNLWFAAGGIDFIPDFLSFSLMFNVGWSPNAQRPEDLAGRYDEWGGYIGSGFAGGYSFAQNEEGIVLHMGSAGIGFGYDFHLYEGVARVFDTLTIGP